MTKQRRPRGFSPRWAFLPFAGISLGLICVWIFSLVPSPVVGAIAFWVGIGMLITGALTAFDGASQDPEYDFDTRKYNRWSRVSRAFFILAYLIVWISMIGGIEVARISPNPNVAFWSAIAALAGFSLVRMATYRFLPERQKHMVVLESWSTPFKILGVLTALMGTYWWVYQEMRGPESIGNLVIAASIVTYSIWGGLETCQMLALYKDDEPLSSRWNQWRLPQKLGMFISGVLGFTLGIRGYGMDDGIIFGSGIVILIFGSVLFYPRMPKPEISVAPPKDQQRDPIKNW